MYETAGQAVFQFLTIPNAHRAQLGRKSLSPLMNDRWGTVARRNLICYSKGIGKNI